MALSRMGFGSSKEKIEYFELRSLEWVGGFGVSEQFWNKRNKEGQKQEVHRLEMFLKKVSLSTNK
jgi:hypothetical protein